GAAALTRRSRSEHTMTLLLYGVAALLGAIALAIAYATLAVNLVANREDLVNTIAPMNDDPVSFMRALHGAAGQESSPGNAVTLYQNGDEIFPPMLAAIRASRETVHFSSYVFWSGTIAGQFADAFCDAAQRGVKVRLIVDSEGSSSKLDRALVQRLREAGCRFTWYRRAQWFDVGNYDHRTHRRLLVVDGTVAFTGGAGIADQWLGSASDSGAWRDSHVRVTGPAVRALQAGFTDNWNQCTDELLLAPRDYPSLEHTGDAVVMVVISTPTGGASPAQRVMGACIGAATRTLHLTNAYFVPTPAFVDALCAARQRGVDVKIIVPGPYHNKPMVRRASRHTWRMLLARGVELYEHQVTMVHAKTLVLDGRVGLVGSINFDPRSFALNAEAGVVVADDALAESMERAFQADLANSRRVDAASLAAHPFRTRAADALMYWLRAQL
ncbi:MAG: cardiolipin synthase, partial [Gemmatimonadetes bacterium]|nr:cardiolipin synthase [Gemmatimonadota bacterium]